MRVVNLKHARCTHYIGRGRSKSGIGMRLGNPFLVEQFGRAEAIERFRLWALGKPEILDRIAALPEDAVLGCWCKPEACHGDEIVRIWQELRSGKDG